MVAGLARRGLLWAVGGGLLYLAFQLSRPIGWAATAAAVFALVGVRGVLPRLAHGAFVRAEVRRARLYYRLLGLLRLDREARQSVAVSLAACALAEEDPGAALERLERLDVARLGEATRAVWLNNRAYALARLGRDPERALADAAEAVELRPDVAGFRHTRGLALYQIGRLDEAIRDLEAVWARDVSRSPLLEAERCFDLGLAWHQKGEVDYAADYFRRAERAAPESTWARRARDRLDGEPPLDPALAAFL